MFLKKFIYNWIKIKGKFQGSSSLGFNTFYALYRGLRTMPDALLEKLLPCVYNYGLT